jgi:hypothetical protein
VGKKAEKGEYMKVVGEGRGVLLNGEESSPHLNQKKER